MTPWEIKATEIANCNCAYGCPCQFNALPTYGDCQAAGAFQVEKGNYGDVDLSGVKFGWVLQWPGAVHEGQGKMQPFVDTKASDAQRDAILKIMMGEDTDPAATVWAVYTSTMEKIFDPVICDIEFDVDVEARTAKVTASGVMDLVGGPIRNATTGEESRSRIDLPNGFEYAIAEMGSASSTTQGNIELNLKDSYGQFAHMHLNNHGMVKN